jgi:HEAT repeat protein
MPMLRAVKIAALASLLCATVSRAGQVPFERAVQDLSSSNASTRFRAAQLLKEAAYPEAAVPLAKAVTDPIDEVQLEAIAGEVNIFLADKIVARKRVGFLIEVRTPIQAEAAFSVGPLALGPRSVPPEVLTALRAAGRDNNPRVALEALYAFGALSSEPSGAARRELLRMSGLDLAAMIGMPDPSMRFAALRVIGRLFARRAEDDGVDPSLIQAVGDGVITALNDKDRVVRSAAIDALGSMHYQRGLQALTDLFKYYGNGELALAALDAIARIGHASSASLLTSALASKDATMKMLAIEGLVRIGDASNLSAIDATARGERNEAMLLAVSFADVTLSNATVDHITEALLKPKLHDQALQYLVELSASHRSAFARSLQDPDPRIRAAVVDALGLALDPAALPTVQPITRDPNPQVAKAAERAVARLKR